jgi:hypothetical protein
MDPTQTDLATTNDVQAAAAWAGLRGDPDDADAELGSLLTTLGTTSAVPLRTIASISGDDWHSYIGQWRIPTGQGMDRAPTPIERAQAGEIGRFVRIKLGVDTPVGAAQANASLNAQLQILQAQHTQAQADLAVAQTAQISSAAKRKIKLKDYLGSMWTENDEAELAPTSAMDNGLLRWETIFGVGQLPPQDRTPTIEQFSALLAGLKENTIYVDLSAMVPFAYRHKRSGKISTYQLGKDTKSGMPTFKDVEILGPSDIGVYEGAWGIFRTLVIYADAIDLGTLDLYNAKINKYAKQYGPNTWGLLYQTCVRARCERAPRIYTAAKREKTRRAGLVPPLDHPLDDARPWEHVFQELVKDTDFWREEFVENAQNLLTHLASEGDIVDGDAPIAKASVKQRGSVLLDPGLDTGKGMRRWEEEPTPRKAPKVRVRARNVSACGNFYTSNRNESPLCDQFNEGACQPAAREWPRTCPADWGKSHQCSKCLGDHPGSGCTRHPSDAASQANRAAKGGKGKGARRIWGSGGRRGGRKGGGKW